MISFLGTSAYLECMYATDDFSARPSRFIQTALYEMLEKEGEQMDKVYIFLTKEAEEKNFEDYYDERNKTHLDGLKKVWKEHFPEHADKLIPVPMKSGQLESEQWELFEQIYNLIEENDELYFDITHSFRSNPVIALIISNFARTMKNAKIKRLFYGNFEVLGPAYKVKDIPLEQRVAPIVDITSMMELLDWTVAVDSFLRTGNPVQIKNLSKEKVKENKGDKDYIKIKQLSLQLYNFSKILEMSRGLLVEKQLQTVFKTIKNVGTIENEKLPQFSKLVDKITEKLAPFSENDIENMWGISKWCYDHGLYQQSITFLSENIITNIAYKIGADISDENIRMAISGILSKKLSKEFNPEDFEKYAELIDPIQSLLDQYEELKTYAKVAATRNDMNHAGNKGNYKSIDSIEPTIKEVLEQIKPFFKTDK